MSDIGNFGDSAKEQVQQFLSSHPLPNYMVTGEWKPVDRPWKDYPIGTKARISWDGGYWIKTNLGWQWHCGSTFPTPGAANVVCEVSGTYGFQDANAGTRLPLRKEYFS